MEMKDELQASHRVETLDTPAEEIIRCPGRQVALILMTKATTPYDRRLLLLTRISIVCKGRKTFQLFTATKKGGTKALVYIDTFDETLKERVLKSCESVDSFHGYLEVGVQHALSFPSQPGLKRL